MHRYPDRFRHGVTCLSLLSVVSILRIVINLGRLNRAACQSSRIAGAASAWAIAVGILALLGYALNLRILVRPIPGTALMAPGTAVAFIAAGAALWLVASDPAAGSGRRRAGQVLGLLVALFAVVVLAEYILRRGAGIDLVLFPGRVRAWTANDVPGRPSPYSAVTFLVTGLSLALLDADPGHRHRAARVLVPATALITCVALIGYVFGVNYLRHGAPHVPGVSVGSVISFVVLALGILASRPDRPPAHVFARPGPGAAALRRMALLLIGALLLALLVTGLGKWGPDLGDGLISTAIAATVAVALYLVFLQAKTALDVGGRALSDERDFSQTVLRAMREGVIIVGPDGEVLQVNPRWCEITGLPAQDVIGLRPPYPWWAPEDAAGLMAQLAGNLAADSDKELSLMIHRADGTRSEVESTSAPVWHHGELRMIVGTYRDLTERNRAEAEVRQAAQQLDHFFDLSTDLMCIAGTDGYFKRLNPVWTQTLGYSREELLARPFLEFIHPDDVDRTAAESAEQAAAGKVSVSFDNRYRCRDGSYRWLNWNATPVPETSMVYAVARDTTGQRLADQTRSLLAAIVDNTDDPTVGMTLDGTIISWNSAAERSYGYRSGEAVGHSIQLITGPGGRDEMPAILDQMARGVPLTHHNTVRRHKDGTRRQVEVTISPIRDAAGAVIGAASVARDIGERLQFEQALAGARDEALAAAQLKSQFVAMVSHEIRTPMNGVLGLTALLLDSPLEPAQRRYAEAIGTSGRALLTIINDILDFSKIEAGKIELADADFRLDTLLESAVQAAAEVGRDKDLEVVGYYPPTLPTAVRGDEGRLRQILLNLAGNAVKFTDRGHVLISANPAVRAADGRPQVTVTVSDTGIGIAPDDLALLFKPFSQVDAATSRQFGGTGLGLTISRQLVELMGGQLGVQSQPGRGSEFSFTIPLSPQSGPSTGHGRAGHPLSARRLLIADANPTRQRLISEHTTAWGMNPTAAADSRTALDLLHDAAQRGQVYDVAVIDHHMPGPGDGDLAQQIIADPALAAIKLVLLTSGAYHDDEAAIAVGAAVLPKPISPSQLYNSLLNLLDLPAAREGQRARSAPARDAAGGDRGLILVAEDNEINQMVAADNLAILGYRVDLARNGIEAVQLATAKSYQAILMDCQMPKMDGYTATARLRQLEGPDQHVPIIAMTAGALAEDEQRCLAAGMDDYLAKPIDPQQLRAALSRWAAAAPPVAGQRPVTA
jgi:PAS domain S-box-containing protein